MIGIRRNDRVLNARISESDLRCFGIIERMENGRITKGCMRECVGSRLVCLPQKRWIDSVNDYLKKRGLNVG